MKAFGPIAMPEGSSPARMTIASGRRRVKSPWALSAAMCFRGTLPSECPDRERCSPSGIQPRWSGQAFFLLQSSGRVVSARPEGLPLRLSSTGTITSAATLRRSSTCSSRSLEIRCERGRRRRRSTSAAEGVVPQHPRGHPRDARARESAKV